MTRDEYRNACIETMVETALAGTVIYADPERPHVLEFSRDNWIIIMTAAFDSLYGIARVNPIEATVEIMEAGAKQINIDYDYPSKLKRIWNAMSAAGDLTNPPEKNP